MSTPNKVTVANAERLPGVQLGHSVPPMQYGVMGTGGCLVVVAQWQCIVNKIWSSAELLLRARLIKYSCIFAVCI